MFRRRGEQRASRKKWYEKYLPFVARSQEMQLCWLRQAFRKGTLTDQEIMPYIRLLLETEGEEEKGRLAELFATVDDRFMERLLVAAEVYDVPRLTVLAPRFTLEHAVAALAKSVPRHEKHRQQVLDKVFHAVYNRSPRLFEQAAGRLLAEPGAPPHFAAAHARFLEFLEDEKLLSSLYPKARMDLDLL